jgi:tRNA(Ile)-lysidine synthase
MKAARAPGTAARRRVVGDATARVTAAVSVALSDTPRAVLAVSGGRDSMVMLDAVARACSDRVACVATFDHGTGEAASAAVALVERHSRDLGLPVRRARVEAADAVVRGEAAWREARWLFLRRVASEMDAVVVTAHTRDDQVETVFMRALRDSGARGLAALYARSDVVRALLEISRADVAAYAEEGCVEWVEDPSNQSRDYLRNRVRLDLLPALERAHPGLSAELLALSRRATRLRDDVEALVDTRVRSHVADGVLTVARADLLDYDATGLAVLWPALAARLGVVLDRRGTGRIAEFTIKGRPGGRIQLSGGYEALLHHDTILVRRARLGVATCDVSSLEGTLSLNGWRFRRVGESGAAANVACEPWSAALPAELALSVRPWRPGDRMTPLGAVAPRRVKGLLRDAGVDAGRRSGWPVVLAGEEIVWIPGVRRGAAATVRPGRPMVVYECERDDN